MSSPTLARTIAVALRHATFVVHIVSNPVELRLALRKSPPHLAIVDVSLTHEMSLSEFGDAPSGREPPPIIALTARRELTTALDAFSWGVDDLLAPPFWPEELLARAMAVMRRAYRTEIAFSPTITVGDLVVDILNRRVTVGAAEVYLTPAEQAILYFLAANAGWVLSRDEIMNALGGADYGAGSNVVDQHVVKLRKKLGDDVHHARYITTIVGRGYMFVAGGG